MIEKRKLVRTMASKRLAYSIVEYLRKSVNDGIIPEEQKDSIDVAVQCICDAFGVDEESDRETLSMGPGQSLADVFGVYEKTRDKMKSQASTATENAGSPDASETTAPVPSEQDKASAEDLKRQGNTKMTVKDYPGAIACYSAALRLCPKNEIYLSNRAAAYSQNGDYELALLDASECTKIAPNYSKGWSRLGHAKFLTGDAKGAMEAYKHGSELDPSSELMKKGYETAKKKFEETGGENSQSARSNSSGLGGLPDLGGLMNSFGSGSGDSSGGPDLSSLMQNPAIMQMAQQFMQSGAMDNIMGNPDVQRMAQQFMSGGQRPSLNDIMNNPELANLARNFMGGSGDAEGSQ